MNKGNKKINITAEFVSIMRVKQDPKNLYFVSQKGKRFFDLARRIFSEKKLNDIFEWRLILSKIFDDKILKDRPEQVIDLAAGYSLRGFNECLRNRDLIYIDIDFDSVISRKKLVLNEICVKENIVFPQNYFLISADVLKTDIFDNIKKIVIKNKKTLIIAEGLTSYFGLDDFQLFLENIKALIGNFDCAEFYSNESIKQPKGLVHYVLRYIFVSLLTRSKHGVRFKSEKEFEIFLDGQGIHEYKITNIMGFVMYSISNNKIVRQNQFGM